MKDLFLGTVRIDDSFKYPIPRFGYPPLKRPQHQFTSSYNDLSYSSSNPATHSLDATSWSNNNDNYQVRPSISQHAHRSHDSNGNEYHEVRISMLRINLMILFLILGEITDTRTK